MLVSSVNSSKQCVPCLHRVGKLGKFEACCSDTSPGRREALLEVKFQSSWPPWHVQAAGQSIGVTRRNVLLPSCALVTHF